MGWFYSDNLDASSASSIGVSFWYYLEYTEDDDLTIYYYDGSTYDPIANIGGGTENTWLHYTAIITDFWNIKSDLNNILLISR